MFGALLGGFGLSESESPESLSYAQHDGSCGWPAVAVGCRDARSPAHAVKGIAKAMLPRMTNVKACRYERAAFTRLFIYDALRTRRKVPDLEARRCLSGRHCCQETREDKNGEHSHIFSSLA
jgi:hypothetical protein